MTCFSLADSSVGSYKHEHTFIQYTHFFGYVFILKVKVLTFSTQSFLFKIFMVIGTFYIVDIVRIVCS